MSNEYSLEKLEAINEKVHAIQLKNRALLYSMAVNEHIPKMRECMMHAGITEEELARFDAFISEAMDICEKYLKGEKNE